MSFKKVYKDAVVREGYHIDGAQAKAADCLDALYTTLLQEGISSGLLPGRLLTVFNRGNGGTGTKGCYLWGGVGLGKTWLMDLFFEAVPVQQKSRFHFHEFMQRIHSALAGQKRQRDPLKTVARSMLAQARLICLDEFHVSDITDAMLLYGLLDEMYRQGAVFIMTSNVMPDDLYQNGLQRSRFLPAIELIKQRSHVLQFDGDKDYRLQKHLTNRNYYCPLRVDTDCQLEERFRKLAKGEITKETKLTISNRPVYARARAENIVWFDFPDICGGPRAAVDYIDIAQRYDFVIISNVFKLNDTHDDIARRFINLVDELYDRDTGLIISADGWPGELYSGRRFAFEFERTISRLQEIRCRNLQPLDDSWVDAKIDGAGKSAG